MVLIISAEDSPMPPRESTAEAEKEVRRIYAEWELRPLEHACTGIARCCHFNPS